MRLSVKFDILFKGSRFKKLFSFVVVLLTSLSFILALTALLLLSDTPTIRSVVAGYEWLAIGSFMVWLPSILWVLFDFLVDVAVDNE